MNILDEKLVIDSKKIKDSVRLQIPIEITSYILPRNQEVYFREILDTFLECCHQEHLKEYLNFCLGELLTNAKKANTKRIYFKNRNLDINNKDDYELGMKTFKEDTMGDLDFYLELQKKHGLFVKLVLRLDFDKIVIEIKNNAVLTSFEKERIQQKLDSVQQYKNMDEVVSKVIDQTEGAGLGIIIIVLMLQKVGLSKENYQVFSTDTETITRIILPCNKTIYEGVDACTNKFLELQKGIPVLKDNFEEIVKIVEQDSIDREKLLSCLRKDTTLALIAVSHTLGKENFGFSLLSSLKLLSDEEIRYIFSKENPLLREIEKTPEIESIWEHARNTAYFSYNLSKNVNSLSLPVSDEYMYLLGLFNSIGYQLIATASEEQKQAVKETSSLYANMAEKVEDMFLAGNGASLLNLCYMRKMGFSEQIAGITAGWQCMRMAPENSQNILHNIYLAEIMQYYDEGIIDYYQIRKDILSEFQIKNEKQLKYAISQMKQAL